MNALITDSRFYMWRTLFALTHVDEMVTDEEVQFMRNAIEMVEFSSLQRDQLCHDMAVAQDVTALYCHISAPKDRADFFQIANELVRVDGDYSAQEQKIIETLKGINAATEDDLEASQVGASDFSPSNVGGGEEQQNFKESINGENKLLSLLQKIFHRLT